MGKVNAYSLFVSDEAKRREREGISFNRSTLYKELDQKWRDTPDHVKQRYKDRAKSSSNSFSSPRTSVPPATPSTSAPTSGVKTEVKTEPTHHQPHKQTPQDSKANITDLKEEILRGIKRSRDDEEPTEQKEAKKQKIRPGIPNWKNIKDKSTIEPIKYLQKNLFDIRETCLTILKARGDRCFSIPIYSFSVNVLCKQKKDKEEIFVPLEIGIYAYSIKDGALGKPYHVIIDSGPIPPACLNIAHDHATANHKISIPTRVGVAEGYPAQARSDYKKIYKELIEYTSAGERTILIDSHYHLAQVLGGLDWLYKKACEVPGVKPAKPTSWTVMPVTEFVAGLVDTINESLNGFPTFAIHYYLKKKQDNSIMDYNEEYMCEYHKEKAQSKWCAKSCAMRMLTNLDDVFDMIYRQYMSHLSQTFGSQPQITCHANGQQQPAAVDPASNQQQSQAIDQNHCPVYEALPPMGPAPLLAIEDGTSSDLGLSELVQPVQRPYATIVIGDDNQFVEEIIPEPVKPKKKKNDIVCSVPVSNNFHPDN